MGMWFTHLTLANLRCFERLDYTPAEELNLIYGPNGSGKTSLLEALSLAGIGKSFETSRIPDIVRSGQRELWVAASFIDRREVQTRIVVHKSGDGTKITVGEKVVPSASQLAHMVPTLVLTSRAGELLTGGPSNRRALLDRTMFHVEPSYVEAWKRYRNALKQRNALLRSDGTPQAGRYWHEQIERHASQIHRRRLHLADSLNMWLKTCPATAQLGSIRLDYNCGWNLQQGLCAQLDRCWDRDQRAGHTQIGAHRADLKVTTSGVRGGQKLSRGQSKTVVAAILCGQARFIAENLHVAPIMLVDDLAAELDDRTRGLIVDMLVDSGGQGFFTAIRPTDLPELRNRASKVFHVEQCLIPAAN